MSMKLNPVVEVWLKDHIKELSKKPLTMHQKHFCRRHATAQEFLDGVIAGAVTNHEKCYASYRVNSKGEVVPRKLKASAPSPTPAPPLP